MQNKFWTIPNILSLYRLLSFPFLLGLAINGAERWFIYLLIFNLITDLLDGLIARTFNMQTEIGARLDSLADIGSYILAFYGIYRFRWDDIVEHYLLISIFFFLYILFNVLGVIRFGRPPSLHLYSFKITGYLQGAFIAWWFLFGFNTAFYYLAIGWGIMACLEEITVLFMLPAPRSNAKGLYWLLKEKRDQQKTNP